MTRNEFLLPDLGEGLTEASIVSWLVAPGDTIVVDQPVVEVESAKSIVELPSPFGGVVEELCGGVGDVITAGSVLLAVTDAGGPAGAPAAPPVTSQAGESSGAVLVGYGTRETNRTVRRPAEGRFGRSVKGAAAPASVAVLDPERRSPVVSPLVRRLAREHGFDATHLTGTGRDSLVLRRDVEAFIRGLPDAVPAASAGPAAPAPPRLLRLLQLLRLPRRNRAQ